MAWTFLNFLAHCAATCIWLEENAIIIVSIDVIASDDDDEGYAGSVDNDVKKKQKLYFPGV